MRNGRVKVFFAVGGNFVRATSDSGVTEAAMRNVGLTVHVSTKLNRSHTVTGETALILPTLGRSERDIQQTRVYAGIPFGPHTQDAAMTESMGPISDRENEHLGAGLSHT